MNSLYRLNLTHRERAAVWDKTAGACHYCGRQTNPFRDFEIDHVIPLSAGGTDDLDNLVGCCPECNRQKAARPVGDPPMSAWPEERYAEYRRRMRDSIAICTLETRDRHYFGRRVTRKEIERMIADLDIERFQLRPGGIWRVWRSDVPRIVDHANTYRAAS